MDDLDQPRELVFPAPTRVVSKDFHMVLGEREFVYTKEGAGDYPNPYDVYVRDQDDNTIKAEFRRGFEGDGGFVRPHDVGPVYPSPDGRYFVGFARYSPSSLDPGYIEVLDREGNTAAVYFEGAFSDWAWTPDGDLLVVIIAGESEELDEGAVLALIDREDLLTGDGYPTAKVLQTFPGGEQTPKYIAVSNAGDQIAYSLRGERGGEFFVMPFQAGGQAHWVAHHTQSLMWTGFSPDDDQLAIGVFVCQCSIYGPPDTSTVVIPNHRDDEPIRLFEDDSYRLLVPLPEGVGSGDPDPVEPTGPFFWDDR